MYLTVRGDGQFLKKTDENLVMEDCEATGTYEPLGIVALYRLMFSVDDGELYYVAFVGPARKQIRLAPEPGDREVGRLLWPIVEKTGGMGSPILAQFQATIRAMVEASIAAVAKIMDEEKCPVHGKDGCPPDAAADASPSRRVH